MDFASIKAQLSSLTLENILPAVLVLAVALAVVKVLCRLFDKLLLRSKISPSLHSFLRSGLRILLYSIAVLMAASSLGFDVTSLVALLSVISLGISLALQSSVANVAGGFMVLTTQPFHVDDWVEVGGVSGTVREIGMSYTRLETLDNRAIFVPNSEIASTKIINYSAADHRLLSMPFTAAHSAPAERVRAILLQAAQQPAVLADPAPVVLVEGLTETCVKYLLRVTVPTTEYWNVNFSIHEAVHTLFGEAGIAVSQPRLLVRMDAESGILPGG